MKAECQSLVSIYDQLQGEAGSPYDEEFRERGKTFQLANFNQLPTCSRSRSTIANEWELSQVENFPPPPELSQQLSLELVMR